MPQTSDIHIRKLNNVHAIIDCDQGIAQELHEHFSYFAPNYAWSPAYKYRGWNGKLYEFRLKDHTIRAGLIHEVLKFAKNRDYSISQDGSFGYTEFSVKEAEDFIKTLNIPEKYTPRDYQIKAFVTCIREGRSIQLAPTSSGKSLLQYLICRYYIDVMGSKCLVIVPTIALVAQMSGDFRDYGYKERIHQITSGVAKSAEVDITISTYHSLVKQDKYYFDQYQLVMVDEVHLGEAKSITSTMDKCLEAPNRFGLTGTLTDSKTSEMALTGMFGKIHKVITTAELMDQGFVADLKIKCLVLEHPEESRKALHKKTYQDEIKFLINSPSRNKFIVNLGLSLQGNSLILFRINDHGKYLYEQLKSSVKEGRNVYFVNGGTEKEDREYIRKIIEEEDDAIIVGSKGTMSTGSNTKKLHNLISAHPNKGKIINLQSIGRALRLASGKTSSTFFDIADDLSWKGSKNHTLNHLIERIKIYIEEKFNYKMYRITLK
ncbi:DNA helicase [Caulobacter phage Cr30]|uniref:DNA helicase n=1 Tax=Caulobacter phage Cr30 TaxID=1357714 RepID=UPI0004A9BA1F|nr:DNA helicase [Caulobacter phage Cr30]AGS81045.1 DNA helicase [Caulobacter phage Cr30]